MTCCPPTPSVFTSSASNADSNGNNNPYRMGENLDCYVKRAGNLEGVHDQYTDYPDNRIENTTIPISKGGIVNVQFKLTEGSSSTADHWELVKDNQLITSLAGLTFSTDGLLSGTLDPATYGKIYRVKVKAYSAANEVLDMRTFNFCSSDGADNKSIHLICPLPGAVVTSKFGMRVHPSDKSKPADQQVPRFHYGVDLALGGNKTVDVICTCDGKVVFAGGNAKGGYGFYVDIEHVGSSGNVLCTTRYAHLAKIYVQVGQYVPANQKIGLEGNTGGSFGNHLHFELMLPNGVKIDPLPYIRGTLGVANKTNPDNSADLNSIQNQNSNAALSEAEIKARMAACEVFSNYPVDPSNQNLIPPSNSPFDTAFDAIMKYEVGAFWNPTLPSVISGSIATLFDKKNVGYQKSPAIPDGEVKFGVAKHANPDMDITNLVLADAKKRYYNSYWLKGKCDTLPSRIAIFHFDACANHGVERGLKILREADAEIPISSNSTDETNALNRLYDARVTAYADIVKGNPDRARFLAGWMARIKDLRGLL